MAGSVAEERSRLAHLMRRAGFGLTPEEWALYSPLGVEGTATRLLHPETVADPVDSLLKQMGDDVFNFDDLNSVKRWWLFRMARTQRPLIEKTTLFWHNHFATANYKVDNARWMWRQNQMLRLNALGNFRVLLQAVGRDAAMLIWLDGNENRKKAPNENFGRELLELFTLGVAGGYRESDVKAAARAFTGWHWEDDEGKAVFDPEQHDAGSKTFLGHTGSFQGDDILAILADHPATARFVCTKLVRFFVQDDPDPNMVASAAAVFHSSGGEIRPALGAILRSSGFYAPSARYAHFKSPAEFALITLRSLGCPLTNGGELHEALEAMSQELFNPPNVKGWREGRSWLNTLTLTARMNFAVQVIDAMNSHGNLPARVRRALKALELDPATLDTPERLVDGLWQLLLPGHTPSTRTRTALVTYATNRPPVDPSGDKPPEEKPFDFNSRVAGLLPLILAAPEYQLA